MGENQPWYYWSLKCVTGSRTRRKLGRIYITPPHAGRLRCGIDVPVSVCTVYVSSSAESCTHPFRKVSETSYAISNRPLTVLCHRV